jgi:ribose transport system permease protein
MSRSRLRTRGAVKDSLRRYRAGAVPARYAFVLITALAAVAIRITVPSFYSSTVAFDVLHQASFLGLVALGQTLVLLVAGIDLSVGAVIGMAVVTLAEFGQGGASLLIVAVATVLLIGAAIGTINGLLVTVRNEPPFIATFGMAILIQGARLAYTEGVPSGNIPRAIRPLGLAGIGIVPYSFLLWLALTALAWVALNRTVYGRQVYATGINREAARMAGVPVNRIVLSTYILCSVGAAIGGLVLSAYVGYVDRYLGTGFELDSIAAAVVGGTSFVGGRGGVLGTVAGVFFLTILLNVLLLAGLNPQLQLVVKGVVIVGAVGLYGLRHMHKQ